MSRDQCIGSATLWGIAIASVGGAIATLPSGVGALPAAPIGGVVGDAVGKVFCPDYRKDQPVRDKDDDTTKDKDDDKPPDLDIEQDEEGCIADPDAFNRPDPYAAFAKRNLKLELATGPGLKTYIGRLPNRGYKLLGFPPMSRAWYEARGLKAPPAWTTLFAAAVPSATKDQRNSGFDVNIVEVSWTEIDEYGRETTYVVQDPQIHFDPFSPAAAHFGPVLRGPTAERFIENPEVLMGLLKKLKWDLDPRPKPV